jgi:cyclase
MRRSMIRLSLVMLVAVWVVMAVSASAQQAPDFSKVEIKTTKIGNNFYTLEGQGGTIGALVGPDGVFLVDTQFAPLTDKLVAAIKQISDGRIRLVVNTHLHGDHTGGDANFAKLGAIVMARDELRAGLAKGNPPPPAGGLPMLTYRGPVTVHMNGEAVQLIPVPVAHTDGDTMVRFPGVDVLMTGDFFRSVGYPNIDRANGGSLKGMLDGLNAVINAAGPNTKVIPGHGPVTDRAGVTAHRDMMMAIRDRVAGLVKQGKTVEEVTASQPAADYDTRVAGATPMTRDRFVGQLYAELKAGG